MLRQWIAIAISLYSLKYAFDAKIWKFLATVLNVNTNQGMLKITPADNNYYFQPGIVLNIFKYVELNLNSKPENVKLN